jgi:acyl-CoA dehydrogenase
MTFLMESELWNRRMRNFVETEMLPYEALLPKFDNRLPEDIYENIISEMKKQNLWAVSAPKQMGGQGADSVAYLGWREALGRTIIWSVMGFHFENPLYVLYSCTEEQKIKYLLPTIRGEKVGAFAQTESDAGADPARMKTRATRKGYGWVLNGKKTLITYAGKADFCLVFAVTDPEKERNGITCFIVDKGTPGFTITEEIETMGGDMPWSLNFEDCYVSDEQILGNVGEGFKIAQTWITRNRFMLQSPICLGAVTRTVEEMLRHFPEKVDNRWLGKVQAEYRRARLLMYNAALKFEANEDARYDAALCKVASNQLAMRVLRHAIDISGSHGYEVGTIFERYYRDIRRFPITEGSTELMKMLVSRALVRGYEQVDRMKLVIKEEKNVSK